jgi:hypothetical protein
MAGGIQTKVGDPIQLNAVLEDGDVSKFPQAILKDADGTPLGASPVDLTHSGNGHYENDAILMPATQQVHATYIIYDDAAHTVESYTHLRGEDVFVRNINNELLENINDNVNSIVSGTLPGQELEGFLEDAGELAGEILEEELIFGEVDDQGALEGEILEDTEELVGSIDDPGDTLEGMIDC